MRKKIVLALLDFVDWFMGQKPDHETYTQRDLELMSKSRELRRRIG